MQFDTPQSLLGVTKSRVALVEIHNFADLSTFIISFVSVSHVSGTYMKVSSLETLHNLCGKFVERQPEFGKVRGGALL
jgi:hypothetical protein